MAKENPFPSFLFDPEKIPLDPKTEVMTTQEFGAYILLASKAWKQSPVGTIPTDDRLLARWTRMTAEDWSKCGPTVLSAFELRGECYELPWMIAEYRRLMGQRKVKSEAGRKGADNRWQKDGTAMADPWQSHSSAIAQPWQSHAKTQNPKTRNLITEVESEKENQRGLGGNADPPPPANEPRVFDSFFSSGSGVTGSRTLDDVNWNSLTALQVFGLFDRIFVLTGVRDARELHRLADKAGVCPARWTMLFLDKVGYAYGQVNGKTRADVEEVNAVALTAAGFKPKSGAPQAPTESACRLFKEIAFDLITDPECKRWRLLSPPGIAVELAKRKGKKAS